MPKKYIVKAGDTLQMIAVSECGSVNMVAQIVKDNRLDAAQPLTPGQVLYIACDDDDKTEIVPMPPVIPDSQDP